MLIWCQTPHLQPTSVAVGARNDHPSEADRPEGTWHSVVEGSGLVVEHIGVDRGWEVGEGGVEAVENRTSRRPEHNPAEESDDLRKINGLKPTAFAPQVASMYFIWNPARPPVSGSGDKMLTHNEYDVGFELVELNLIYQLPWPGGAKEPFGLRVKLPPDHLYTTHGCFTLSLILPNVNKWSSYCPLDCGPTLGVAKATWRPWRISTTQLNEIFFGRAPRTFSILILLL